MKSPRSVESLCGHRKVTEREHVDREASRQQFGSDGRRIEGLRILLCYYDKANMMGVRRRHIRRRAVKLMLELGDPTIP
jgi:hypothetical protein